MKQSKYHRLVKDSENAIASDNLEKCFELLAESLDEQTAAYREYIAFRNQYSELSRNKRRGTLSVETYGVEKNKLVSNLLEFLSIELKPDDVSLLRRTHDRILVVAADNSQLDWENLFPEAFFSHAAIIGPGEAIPEEFRKSDVVILDHLAGKPDDVPALRDYCIAMPGADLLYVGRNNPFGPGLETADPGLFARSANANSRFTIHARLRELLEYRKIYGVRPTEVKV
jgi:hypothetical protein